MLPPIFKRGIKAQIGIEFQPGGVALAVQDLGKDTPPRMEYLPATSADAQALELKTWVQHNRLGNTAAVVALAAQDYQLFLLDAPSVPADELREAVRWRVKDLISSPLDDVVIDVFALPEDGLRGNRRMVYTVVAPLERVERDIAVVKSVGLNLQALDISELCVRNAVSISLAPEENARGIAIARLERGNGSVYLFRGNSLYLTRNFRLDYKAGLLDELPEEALAVELQRSIDYFERQMGQAPPSAVYLFGENVTPGKIGDILTSSFAIPVRSFDLTPSGDSDEATRQRCITAWGAALRQTVA